jgi:hypothetical protein
MLQIHKSMYFTEPDTTSLLQYVFIQVIWPHNVILHVTYNSNIVVNEIINIIRHLFE